MRVMVTGGAGFIGYYVSRYLVNRGFNVLVFDSFERSLKKPGDLRMVGVEISKGNVRSLIDVLKTLKTLELKRLFI